MDLDASDPEGNLATERLLVSQPLTDPLCRVTLLLRDLQIVLEDLMDDAFEWVLCTDTQVKSKDPDICTLLT